MGKVPARPPVAERRAVPSRCTGRACPRSRTWPWPDPVGCSPARTSEACWSPAIPAMRGARAGRSPRRRRLSSARWSARRPSGSAARPGSPGPTRCVRADQAGDAGVGGVGDVQGAARQGPSRPGVDRAEAQLASARSRPVGVGQVEQRGQLGGRGVGGQTDAVGLELEAGAHGPEVLPADAGPDGLARCPLPDHGGGALVGDPHRLDRTTLVGQGRGGHLEHGGGHGGGVELDQPRERRLRENG